MEQWSALVERVAADPDLVAKLTSAASVDERREVLRDAGIEVTDEIRQQAAALGRRLNIDVDDPESWDAVELSEAELSELAAGGGGVYGAIGGGVVSTSVSVFAAVAALM